MAQRDNAGNVFGLSGLLRGLGDLLHQAADASSRPETEGKRPVVESRMSVRTVDGEDIGADFFGPGLFGGGAFGTAGSAPDAEPAPPPPPERREPVVDIMATPDAICAIVELPGAEPDTLAIRVDHDMLTIAASGHGVEYAAEALLPAPVADSAREQSFRNGVLELKWPHAASAA